MSTLKSSAEDLTLNADGANNDIKFQSNGVEKASIDQDGVITAGGAIMTGNIAYVNMTTGDSGSTTNKIRMGAGSDLVIHHDGSNSYIEDTGTGSLRILSSHSEFKNTGDSTTFIRIDSDGLKFGSDTAAANALDDYEEGTWTPVVKGASSDGSYTYDTTRTWGKYSKIGNMVFLQFTFRITGGSAGSGSARIWGLPYTPNVTVQDAAPRSPGTCFGQSITALSHSTIYCTVEGASAYLGIQQQNTTTNVDIPVTDVDLANSIYGGSIFFYVS